MSTDDQSLAVPMTLEEMFSSATAQVRTRTALTLVLVLDLDDSDWVLSFSFLQNLR